MTTYTEHKLTGAMVHSLGRAAIRGGVNFHNIHGQTRRALFDRGLIDCNREGFVEATIKGRAALEQAKAEGWS